MNLFSSRRSSSDSSAGTVITTSTKNDTSPDLDLRVGLKTTDFRDATIVPILLEPDITLDEEVNASLVIEKHSGSLGTICFVARRAGCALCREEAFDLSLAINDGMLEGFGVFAVVKEVGVDDEGLKELGSKYFDFALYLDEPKFFYDALGGHIIQLPYNPTKWFQLYSKLKKVSKRLKKKGIEGNYKGEAWLKGGIILFDKHGNQRYAYLEETGNEIPISGLVTAAENLRNEETVKQEKIRPFS